jgi:hypothetical protein
MHLHNKTFLVNLDLEGPKHPSWDLISDEDWQNLLSNFVFRIADGFAFAGVSQKADLFPDGLNYFADWVLEIVGLVEAEDDIVCIFRLNDQCQAKLLEYDFAVHNFESRKFLNYYEFDSLYFFSGDRIIGYYIHHEGMILFEGLNDREAALIDNLAPHIKNAFIDSATLKNAFEAGRI